MRAWRQGGVDGKIVLTSDHYSGTVTAASGFVELPIELFVREEPVDQTRCGLALPPGGAVKVATELPRWKIRCQRRGEEGHQGGCHH